MIYYPSLDLFNGSVVRLERGDFARMTHFPDEPESWISRFEAAGARNLHLVDLSGARDCTQKQSSLIQRLIRSTRLRVQVGGGIRTVSDAEELILSGAERIVLGSLAIQDPILVEEMIIRFGAEKICIALDVRWRGETGFVMTHGWTQGGTVAIDELLSRFQALGVTRFLCTDIAKDGLMQGPGFELYEAIRKRFPKLEIQASGGVSSLQELKLLQELGLHSAILGRSLLSGSIELSEIFK